MSNRVESILRDRLQAIDEAQTPVGWEEIVELLEEENVAEVYPNRRRRRGLLVFAAAVLAVVLLGVIPLLVRSIEETPPADTATPTTLTVPTTTPEPSPEPLPKADGTVTEWPGNPEVWGGQVGPLGPVTVQQASTETMFIPTGRYWSTSNGWTRAYGGIVETPDGYTALGVTADRGAPALATSADGINWETIDFAPDIPLFTFGVPARLFEAGGWYWIGLNEPYVYRSSNSISWERIDLGGSSPSPMGTPIADQRWHEFGDRIVAPTGGGLIAVNVNSGAVERFDRPWSLPPEGGWWWMSAIDGKLTAFVSTVPETSLTADNPVIEQWETADLVNWDGPFQPVFTTEETTGALVAGDSSTGFLAIEETGAWFETPVSTDHYFSAGGINWREFITLNESPNETPRLIDHNLVPINANGRQGLALLIPNEIHLSADGGLWQIVTLEAGEPIVRRVSESWATSGNRIFYYQHETRNAATLLHSWIISINE